jgi:primosomal protein N'
MEQVLQSVDLVLNTVWARLAFGVAAVAVLVIGVVLLVQWKHQRTRLAMVFGQAADASFYARIDTLTRAFDQQTATQNELRTACAELEKTSHRFYDSVNIEHYDAFAGQAGKFSSSLLMLNRNGAGIILTSLTSTQGSKVYVKRIENWKSDTALSREEEELLKKNNPL